MVSVPGVRVVAGVARGRILQAPPGQGTRPTSDRVREAMFNALASMDAIEGAVFVDLFAGSGALGIEALSRGASSVTFVERDRGAVATIRANLVGVGLDGTAATVASTDAVAAAGDARVTGVADVVLADPPYRFEAWPDLLDRVATSGFEGVLVAESGSPLPEVSGWKTVRAKGYSSTVVTMLRPLRPSLPGAPPR